MTDSPDNSNELLSKIPPVVQSDISVSSDTITICAFNCSEQDVKVCRKCNRAYCIMHANRFSPNFCKECFSNLALMEGKFTRTFEDYDEKLDKLVITKESCTKYYMDGPDWPFLTAWIDTLSDEELRSIWNFHFFVMKTIEAENETRKIEKYRKLREQPLPKAARLVTKSSTTKTTTPDTPESLRAKFKKLGLADVIIEQMIAAMGGTK